MSNVAELPPPKRYFVEDDENGVPHLVDATGERDPCYIVGVESPWAGAAIEEIEQWASEGAYGNLFEISELILEIVKAKTTP